MQVQKGKLRASAIFFVAFATLLILTHLAYLKLPFFWDELGQFVPASLDLYQSGAWIPKSTLPNVHPPGLMAYLALVWKIFGYSITTTRVAMLIVASFGVLFSFLLAIRLSRQAVGAPAFAAVAFLLVSPMFYTQAMMAQLDMPAMTLTALALLLFFEDRLIWCAITCTVLVLVKETAISTPFVLAVWLMFRDRRWCEALYFLSPAIALALWLLALHRSTGHWLGNDEFARYNVADSLQIGHIFGTLQLHLRFLFLSDGLWIGAITLFVGMRVLRGRDWTIALIVAAVQILLVSIFGGASLDRYCLPVFPILYAAIAAAGSVYPRSWRWASQFAMLLTLLIGFFWNPPYPFSFENNLAMTDFVKVHQEAASYLEAWMPNKRIASAWPFTDEIRRPEMGYVQQRIDSAKVDDFRLTTLANLNRNDVDVLVVFSRIWMPEGGLFDSPWFRKFLERNWGYHTQATPDQIRNGLGYVPIVRWTRHGQWVEIYVPEK